MRIYGPNGTTLGTPAASTRRTSSTGFSLPEDAASTSETRAAVAPKAAGNIDALLALQGVVGGVQWGLKLPSEIVWVHVALAVTTWLAVLWTVATAGRLEPRTARSGSDARQGRTETPAPALSQS